MGDYSFWADVMASFRTSTDLVKIIWLLAPAITLAAFTMSIIWLKRLTHPAPVATVTVPNVGIVTLYSRDVPATLTEWRRLIQAEDYAKKNHDNEAFDKLKADISELEKTSLDDSP